MADTDNKSAGSVQLDPTATLQELVALHDVKARAAAGAAQMVEDYLKNRALVLATHNTQLMAANEALTARLAALEAADGGTPKRSKP